MVYCDDHYGQLEFPPESYRFYFVLAMHTRSYFMSSLLKIFLPHLNMLKYLGTSSITEDYSYSASFFASFYLLIFFVNALWFVFLRRTFVNDDTFWFVLIRIADMQ